MVKCSQLNWFGVTIGHISELAQMLGNCFQHQYNSQLDSKVCNFFTNIKKKKKNVEP